MPQTRLPGVTHRQCSHILTRYTKIEPNRKYSVIDENEYIALRAQALAEPWNRSLPRATKSVFHFNQAWFLEEDVILRHGMTKENVWEWLKAAEPEHILLLAMSLGVWNAPSSSKLQHLSYTKIEARSNSKLFNKVLEKLTITLFPQLKDNTNRLVCVGDEHIPHLPVHLIAEEDCIEIVRIFGRLGSQYEQTYKWRGIEVVPYQLYQNKYIEMVRVLPKHEYDNRYGRSYPGQVTMAPYKQPFQYVIGGDIYYDAWESFLIHGASKTLFKLCASDAMIESSSNNSSTSSLSRSLLCLDRGKAPVNTGHDSKRTNQSVKRKHADGENKTHDTTTVATTATTTKKTKHVRMGASTQN